MVAEFIAGTKCWKIFLKYNRTLSSSPGTLVSGDISFRGVARNFFWGYTIFWGGIKLQYSYSIAVLRSFLPHKKFTWTDFGVYMPIAMPLISFMGLFTS